VGNITYPAGGEIRFTIRAWQKFGWFLEKDWHTDKERMCVWTYPPGVREAGNGGVTQPQAEEFAAKHKIEGYVMCGTPDGGATWEEICYGIFSKGFVIGAIPIYENYTMMQGGDGSFPDPRGEIAGFHALCFYGYDEDNLYLVHSWGEWCGQFGRISRKYFNQAKDLSVWMVVLDKEEFKVGQEIHATLRITSNVPARVKVDNVEVGNTPLSIAIEHKRMYVIAARALEGVYVSQQKLVDDSVSSVEFTLEALPSKPRWEVAWDALVEFIKVILNAALRR
jgi:hypothetical protein